MTLVERKTLYTRIIRLDSLQPKPLADTSVKHLKSLKKRIHTITLDNGTEFREHQKIAQQLNADIYFAHPHASWERGINENTNGLIRQYFPKNTDFNQISDEQIQHVMDRLNNRPRKTRGGYSPNELFLRKRVDLLAEA